MLGAHRFLHAGVSQQMLVMKKEESKRPVLA